MDNFAEVNLFKNIMSDKLENNPTDIFERFLSGETIPMNDPGYKYIAEEVENTFTILQKLNNTPFVDEVRTYLEELTSSDIDLSTRLFPPFHTNYGKNIKLGKNVFINHNCSFLDLGGITIEDNVMIGPKVSITSENHPVEIEKRNSLVPAKVVIKKGAWIGAGAIILPGVTVGENSVVAAGAVVNRNVPNNKVVGGVPAKVIKSIL